MWSDYTKTFVFRDCFDSCMVDGNVKAINKLLSLEQKSKEYGAFITTDILSVDTIAKHCEAYKNEDEGSWRIDFMNSNKEIASISIPCNGEIHLCFEIEEEIETGEFIIHYCAVKAFEKYQL